MEERERERGADGIEKRRAGGGLEKEKEERGREKERVEEKVKGKRGERDPGQVALAWRRSTLP